MAGQDKGLIQWREHALIEHVLTRISPQVERIAISANRNLEYYRRFGFDVYPDLRPGFQGPLSGIEACATHCRADYTLIVSCDMPLLPADLCVRLLTTLKTHAIPATFVDDGERLHYLCSLVETSVLPTISGYLDNKKRSVKGWLGEIGAKASRFDDCARAFRNVNEPNDLSF